MTAKESDICIRGIREFLSFTPIALVLTVMISGCGDTKFTASKKEKEKDAEPAPAPTVVTTHNAEVVAQPPVKEDGGIVVDPGEVIPIPDPPKTCAADSEEYTQQLSFPDPGGCPFGSGSNLPYNSAPSGSRNEQIRSVTMPAMDDICDISITAPNQTITYDDTIIVAVEDYIAGSYGWDPVNMTNYGMAAENGHFKYDWLKIRGHYYSGASFCQPDTTCTIPVTQSTGILNFDISKKWFDRITTIDFSTKPTMDVKVVVTGNKQSSDCRHSAMNFVVNVKYIPKEVN